MEHNRSDWNALPPNVQAEFTALQNKVRQLERDNRMLAVINENAEQLRKFYEAEKKLQYFYNDLLLENCPNMIFVFNEQLRLVFCSNACAPLLSVTERADLTNQFFCSIFSSRIKAEWIDKVYHQNREVLEQGTPCFYNDTIFFSDDSFIHAQVAISLILDENSIPHGTIMTVNDITELTLTKHRAEEASRSKSSFLANMSHEIRTPMNAVKGLSELLALTELDAMQRNYVNNIISSSNSLLAIINDVLDFSKIDAQKVEFVEGPYRVEELITNVCNVVNVRAEDKNLLLTIDASPDLPVSFIGDDVRIKQILTNILTNAVKYTNEGFVHVTLDMETEGDTPVLICSVEDSGIGIREEDIPAIFDAFSRADLQANRSITGTGLGLSISKQLALAMGGDITAKSVYGEGSVFTLRLPQKIADAQPIVQVDRPEDKKVLLLPSKRTKHIASLLERIRVPYVVKTDLTIPAETYTHCIYDAECPEDIIGFMRDQVPGCRFGVLIDMKYAMSLSHHHDTILYLPLFITKLADFLNDSEGMPAEAGNEEEEDLKVRDTTVLVVDDNEINLIVSSEMLRAFEAEVVCADSGDKAIELCNEQLFDLIFMDHMMPDKDGIETALEIRAGHSPNRKTPILALTANVANDMQSYYLNSGMNDVIAKPVEFPDLSKALRKWLPKEKLSVPREIPEKDITRKFGVKEKVTSDELIAAMDNFGLYSSEVMRELNGNFNAYILRMEVASKALEELVQTLNAQVAEEKWPDFSKDILILNNLLYGAGARDCAARAQKLAQAAQKGNVEYIHQDFFSLMGNMYMLNKKLDVIVPIAKNGNLQKLPLNVPQYLYECLDRLGHALDDRNAGEAMTQIAQAAAFSLDKDLDMVLKEIKRDLELGNFESAKQHQATVFRRYEERINNQETGWSDFEER